MGPVVIRDVGPPKTLQELNEPMRRGRRLQLQKEILIKHANDLLSEEDKKNLIYWKGLEGSMFSFTFFFWTPLCLAFYLKYKQDPIKNAHLARRIFFIQAIQLPSWFYSYRRYQSVVNDLDKKILGGLTDYEILNFDLLFAQLKA